MPCLEDNDSFFFGHSLHFYKFLIIHYIEILMCYSQNCEFMLSSGSPCVVVFIGGNFLRALLQMAFKFSKIITLEPAECVYCPVSKTPVS